MPDWVADKERRLAKIRAAKAELEAAAKAAAAAKRDGAGSDDGGSRSKPGRKPKPPSATSEDMAQRNFTDPDSRVLPTKRGFIGGCNAPAAVDGQAQIIVAQELTNAASDQPQSAPSLNQRTANLKCNPDEVSADAGYCSEANLETLKRRRITAYFATGRQKPGAVAAAGQRRHRRGRLVADMATKLRRAGRRSRYRLRKQIVEPVFGQIKHARGFRQFLLGGLDKVKFERAIICTVHNLTKLVAAAA